MPLVTAVRRSHSVKRLSETKTVRAFTCKLKFNTERFEEENHENGMREYRWSRRIQV